MNIKLFTFLIFFILFNKLYCFSQSFLNLDFEVKLNDTNSPKHWSEQKDFYKINLDSISVRSGRYSLLIQEEHHINGRWGGAINSMPAKGSQIKLTGYIKTQSVTDGFAGLFIRIDKVDKILSYKSMDEAGVTGTSNWKKYEIILHSDSSAKQFFFGAVLTGKGSAWFDKIEVYIDNEKIKDIMPSFASPSKEEINWLKVNCIPIKSLNAESGFEDLNSLNSIINNAKIVGLGEVTHGSSEIFKIKHRLIEYLSQKLNFNIFALEANMPESDKLNDYISNYKGSTENAANLLRRLHFWTWDTQEVLKMVDWMKVNNTKAESTKLLFAGFDMQYPYLALENISNFHKGKNDTIVENCRNILKLLEDIETQKRIHGIQFSETENMEIELTTRCSYIENYFTKINKNEFKQNSIKDIDWIKQNGRILSQYIKYRGYDEKSSNFKIPDVYRDSCLAENINWIYQFNPRSKIIVWAHNGHIQNIGSRMGELLKNKFGKEYLSVGFAFHKGSFTGMGYHGLGPYPAQSSYPGTYEYYFQAINEPIFALDLRKLSPLEKDSKWLFNEKYFRSIGSHDVVDEFSYNKLKDLFDIIVFINTSSASKLLD